MSRLPEHAGQPDARPATRQGKTEVQIQVSWCCRLSGRGVAQALTVLLLVVAALTGVLPVRDELARVALYLLAGFLSGSRPRVRP